MKATRRGPDGYCCFAPPGDVAFELNWLFGFPTDPHHQIHWAPLPQGRRPRQLERQRRARVVREHRALMLAVLVQRVRQLVPQLRAEPIHGPRCSGSPGCPDCAAITAWRVEYEVISGAVPAVRRYLFP